MSCPPRTRKDLFFGPLAVVAVLFLIAVHPASAQSRRIEIAQKAEPGFRIQAAGFSSDNRSLYYIHYNQHRDTQYSIRRYDLRTRKSSVLLGPLGRGQFLTEPHISPSGRWMILRTSAKKLLAPEFRNDVDYSATVVFDTLRREVFPFDLRGDGTATPSGEGGWSAGFAFNDDETKLYFITTKLQLGTFTIPPESLPALVEFSLTERTYRVMGERLGPSPSSEADSILQGDGYPDTFEPRHALFFWMRSSGQTTVYTESGPTIQNYDASALHLPTEQLGPPAGDGYYRLDVINGTLDPVVLTTSSGQLVPETICYSPAGTRLIIAGQLRPLDPALWYTEDAERTVIMMADLKSATLVPFEFPSLTLIENCRLDASDRFLTVLTPTRSFARGGRKQDNDVFRLDLLTGAVLPISTPTIGKKHDGWYPPRYLTVSLDARLFAFTHGSARLVRGDRTVDDLFLVRISD